MQVKPKLLVTASTFPRWEGDTEPRFILDLSKALLEYYDVTVLAPAYPGAKTKEVLEGVKVIRYHYFPIHKWETLCYPGAIVPRIKEKKIRALLVPFLLGGLWGKLFRILKNYDIVHAHWIIPQGIIQSLFKKPYMLTGHGGDVLELNSGIFFALKRRALKKARRITVVSSRLKEKLETLYHIEDIAIQSMGCDTSKFSPQKRVENYFNQNEKKVILFVGRFVKIKGIEYLIKAMDGIEAKLIIVGKGPQEEALKEKAAPYGEKIMFMEAQNHNELSVIYSSSDIFVIPSITLPGGVTEGTPTVLIEAMASGIPVIGTRTGGIPEIIEDGINGYLVEERDVALISNRIIDLINDDAKRKRLSKQAQLTAEKYDYKVIGRRYKELIDKMYLLQ